MNKILLFPTMIGHTLYEKADSFKELIFLTHEDHLSENKQSHELTGHLTLQHDERYADFFTFVTASAMEYVASLEIDPTIYDYNIVKSWFNITKSHNNPRHDHKDAHMSFAYYIHTPENAKKMICFFAETRPNELYSGMFANNLKTFNFENAQSWSLDASQGSMYIFPAKLQHAVIESKNELTTEGVLKTATVDEPINDIKTFRIAIAGDIVLTHKEKALVSLGLQPVKNWRTFKVMQ